MECSDIQDLFQRYGAALTFSDPRVQTMDGEKTSLALIGMVANDYTHKPLKKYLAKCWFTHLLDCLPEKVSEEKWHDYSKWPAWHHPGTL